ncbi:MULTISPECIES: ATP-grasp domain-containing protein [unclassified Pseudomonas]|uniref:ATP-grasp domain-containing protein n=1 Tax=unclassified Pseudomonas TaxID=196821 RepID=UPI002446C615|nr:MULTISPECIES: ATP-grasp domain-containing protein [unclassified Pseudomonas]MDH0302518.1 ATP-grasp domain-containing protein [Pseudomonas sp. GD04091]MDH1983763.1 ATP-grasp domain-containing protein [Pseudomonas sp. GD03689]
MEKIVILVDPLSTGRLYAPAFKAQGFKCIAVISSRELPAHFINDLQSDDFEETHYWDEALLSAFRDRPVSAVVAGCETAVYLADHIAAQLDVPGNHEATSALRRQKFVMQKALKDQGLAHIESRLVTSFDAINECLQGLDEQRAYVVKPINSAATDGVVFAQGRAGVQQALLVAGWDQINDLGEVNQGFIIQPFVAGPEYVLDMVAFGSRYVIASVCKYKKIARNGGQFVYESLDILDPALPELQPLIDYARKAASALDIEIGPIHMEIIWAEEGPVMVEAGARLHGGVAPSLFASTYRPALVDLAVQSYLQKDGSAQTDKVSLVKHGQVGFFYADTRRPFSLPGATALAEAKTVAGYEGHKYFVEPGQATALTIDFATCPGLFWLSHARADGVAEGAERLRTLLWNEQETVQ